MPGPVFNNDVFYELPGQSVRPGESEYSRVRNRTRFRVFFVVLVTALLISLAYTFLRPALYQSTATLLVTPPLLDERASDVTNSQHAELERRALLSPQLLAQARDRFTAAVGASNATELRLSDLGEVLDAKVPAQTNLIELTATGEDSEQLAALLDAWIEVYIEAHDNSLASASSDQNRDIDRQLVEVQAKVEQQRDELESFRDSHDIVSMERSENRVLKRLNGLTDALNEAQQAQITAGSRVEAIKTALAQDRPVGTDRSEAALANLEDRLVTIKEQIRELEREFTPQYMSMDPQITALNRKKDFLEAEIRRKRREGGEIALAEAQQDLHSAGQSVTSIQRQLDEEKRKVMAFTTQFAEHEALKEELALLEEQYRQVQQRQLAMQVDTARQFSGVKLQSLPFVPGRPIYPHYMRDAAISGGLSLALALLAVWFYDYMTRPARQAGNSAPVFVSAVSPAQVAGKDQVNLPPGSTQLLEQGLPRELSEAEVLSLLNGSDACTCLLLTCLLAGFGPARVSRLRWKEIQLCPEDERGDITADPCLPSSPALQTVVEACHTDEASADDPVWVAANGEALSEADLAAMVSCAAHDAGLARPEQVSAAVVVHTLLAWLARRGVRLADLGRLADGIPPRVLAAYAALSPPGEGKAVQDVDTVYPALAAFAHAVPDRQA